MATLQSDLPQAFPYVLGGVYAATPAPLATLYAKLTAATQLSGVISQ